MIRFAALDGARPVQLFENDGAAEFMRESQTGERKPRAAAERRFIQAVSAAQEQDQALDTPQFQI